MSEMPRADLAINQPDVALIFEGGGMRNSYTAPMSTPGPLRRCTRRPWWWNCSRAT